MARRGRPAKPGKRERNGRLQRSPGAAPLYDRGSEWVQARKARFGEHYSSALGRAYAAGLLGEGSEAAARFDAAKRFAAIYRRFIGGEVYFCPLDNAPRGGNNVVRMEVSDRQRQDRDWLFAAMDSMDVAGVRPYFDQLIASAHIDAGPAWLDALLAGGRHPADGMVLEAAIRALDIIAPRVRAGRILVG